MKNHYYLIQIGHMIAQVMEAWESLLKIYPIPLRNTCNAFSRPDCPSPLESRAWNVRRCMIRETGENGHMDQFR